MGVKNYNFKEVDAIFGTNILTGFAEGDDSITVEPNEALFTYEPANDGSGTRSKTNNYGAKITLKFQQTSPSNAIMQAIANSDRVSGAGILPFTLKDGSGASLHFAETAWIEEQPSASYGKASGSRDWVLRTDNMIWGEGGNP